MNYHRSKVKYGSKYEYEWEGNMQWLDVDFLIGLVFSEEIVNQVLDELGLQIGDNLPETPFQRKGDKDKGNKQALAANGGGAENGAADNDNSVDDLMERLNRLKNS